MAKRSAIEVLESRWLLTGTPWGTFPHLIGQDSAAVNYPTITGAGEAIAVIDRGVDYTSPVLGGGFGPGFKVEAGYDYYQNDGDPNVGQGVTPHGTGVAGVLAADPYDYKGFHYQGIAPQAKLIALRENSAAQIKQALDWVITNRTLYNIVAVNLTEAVTSGYYAEPYAAELQTLAAAGVFIGSPVGNAGPTVVIDQPVLDPNDYGAGGIDRTDAIWSGSQLGPAVDVLGPADGVTLPYDDVNYKPVITDAGQGTSWASPTMVGLAALIKQIDADFTPAQIMSIIRDSGVPHYDAGTNRVYPRIDVNAALALAYRRTYITALPAGTAVPTAFGTGPVDVSAAVPAVIEAENYDVGGEGIAYHDSDAQNQGGQDRTDDVDLETSTDATGAYDVTNTAGGEWLNYSVNVSDGGGLYALDARVASNGGGKFHVEVDGQDVTGLVNVPNTGGNQTWQTVTTPGFDLTPGAHSVRVVMNMAGTDGTLGNFNSFTLNSQGAAAPTPYGFTPTPVGTGTTTIEAENFDNGGEGVAYHDSDPSNNGGADRAGGVDLRPTSDSGGDSYAVGWTTAGEWLDYTVNVGATGNYNFIFQVASAGQGGKLHVVVDSTAAPGSVTVPNSGGYDKWAPVALNNVALTAGRHVLRVMYDSVASPGAGAGDFDKFTIAPVGAVSPPGSPPPPPTAETPYGAIPQINATTATTIEAENFDNGGEGVAYHDIDPTNRGGVYRSTAVDIAGDYVNGYVVEYTAVGEWLKYTTNVVDTGAYNITFNAASMGQGGTFHLEVDDHDVTGPVTVNDTGNWGTRLPIVVNGVNLTAGPHVMKIVFDTLGTNGAIGNLDNFVISSASASPPVVVPPPPVVVPPPPVVVPPPPVVPPSSTAYGAIPQINATTVTTIEAENYDNGGEGVAYHDVDPTNRGGAYRTDGVDIAGDATSGYVVEYTDVGEYLKYTVNVVDAGAYNFTFNAASMGSGGTFHLEVDDVAETGPITVVDTGSWDTRLPIVVDGVNLTAGPHVVKLVFDALGSNGAIGNVDNFVISSAGTVPPPPVVVPPPPVVVPPPPVVVPPPPVVVPPPPPVAPLPPPVVPPSPPVSPPPPASNAYVPVTISSSAVVRVEAENFDKGGEGVGYHDLDKANLAGKYRPTDGVDIESNTDGGAGFDVAYTKAGEWLEYTVNVAATRKYNFGFRLSSAGKGGTFHLLSDDAPASTAITVVDSGGWTKWTNVVVNGVQLSAGQHTLKIAFDTVGGSGFVGNLNYFTVTPAALVPPPPVVVPPPPPPPPPVSTAYPNGTPPVIASTGTTTIAIKNFDNGVEGVAYHDADTANLGGQYRSTGVDLQNGTDGTAAVVLGYAKAGEWLKYTVNVTTAGKYTLDFRAASVGAGGNFHVEVDGVNATGTLTVPNTKSWTTYQTVTKTGIALPAGVHVLRLYFDTAPGGWVGNFNWMHLTKTG